MSLPALSPPELSVYEKIDSEEVLFDTLVKKPFDLLLFFETACDDETWTEAHPIFMRKIMDWLTMQIFEEKLPFEFCIRSSKGMRKHFSVLKPFIPQNITLHLKDGSVAINSLLMASASHFFRDVLRRECFEKHQLSLSFSQIKKNRFSQIEAFINQGVAEDLWKQEPKEIIALMRQATAWGLFPFVKEAEDVFCRYITRENVIDTLFMAQQEGWLRLKKGCTDFLNKLEEGFRVFFYTIEDFGFEFLNFSENTQEYFRRLSSLITDLACHGALVDQSAFGLAVRSCPNLSTVDISNTPNLSRHFHDVPKELPNLNISHSSWVSQETLQQIAEQCPRLSNLLLSSCTQLNFTAWGELIKFKELKKLDLSYCDQITNEDLSIILKGTRGALMELSLTYCSKIDETGFFELATGAPNLSNLNISHTKITDPALVDIASRCHLLMLDISYCDQLTEKGILALARNARGLKELNLERCNITFSGLAELRKIQPSLKITD